MHACIHTYATIHLWSKPIQRIEGSNAFPSTWNWNLLGVVTVPKHTSDVHLWSKAYNTSRVANLPFDIDLEHCCCRHYSNLYSSGTPLVEIVRHIEGSKTIPLNRFGASWCGHYSKVYLRGASLVESIQHIEASKTSPSTANWNCLGVVTTPTVTPDICVWSKAYNTSTVAKPSLRHWFGVFLVSTLFQSILQRNIRGRTHTTHWWVVTPPLRHLIWAFFVSSLFQSILQRYTYGRTHIRHRGSPHLPFDIVFEPSWCRHDSNVYSRRTILFENIQHSEGSKTFPSTSYWSFLCVVAITKYIPEVDRWSKAYNTSKVTRTSHRHGIGAVSVSWLFERRFQRYTSGRTHITHQR